MNVKNEKYPGGSRKKEPREKGDWKGKCAQKKIEKKFSGGERNPKPNNRQKKSFTTAPATWKRGVGIGGGGWVKKGTIGKKKGKRSSHRTGKDRLLNETRKNTTWVKTARKMG